MPRHLLHLTWQDFDIAVGRLAYRLKGLESSGIYGKPRGGLCLAVALSHKLQLPLLNEPQDGMIWVDDIVETGRTVEKIAHKCAAICTWVTKSPSYDVCAAYVIMPPDNPWVVFPWEDMQNSLEDMADYYESRKD